MTIPIKGNPYQEFGQLLEKREDAILVKINRHLVWFAKKGKKYREVFGLRTIEVTV